MSFLKISLALLLATAFAKQGNSQAIDRKMLDNLTVTFNIRVEDSVASESLLHFAHEAVKKSYVRGDASRNDFIAPGLKQTEIFKASTDTVVILRETQNQKFISYLDRRQLGEKDKRYQGIRFVTRSDSKNILGYECKLVQAQFPDGSFFQVYYAPAIEPSHKAFERQYAEIPGLVLEYETFLDDGKTRIRLTATAIELAPVPSSLFEWPKSGYKVL